jgi:glycosyltransferase involved in cell wall biosynthesis
MKIAIDARYLSHGLVGGIHTYLNNIMPQIVKQAGQRGHEIVFFADTKAKFELENLPPHAQVRLLPYANKLSSFRNDLFMWKEMAQDKPDLVHFTGNYGFAPNSWKTILTVHDEINLMPLFEIYKGHKKELTVLWMFAWLHFCTRAAVRQTSRIITISNYAKQQILRYGGGLSPNKIDVVHHGCPEEVKRITDEATLADVRGRYNLTKPFVLAEAFKNPDVIARAWQRLPNSLRNTHEIIFFARSPKVRPAVDEAVKAGHARFFQRISNEDKSALFSLCEVFVFPSWIEGFGIPLTEAMTCGTPIIASDRGALPEVLGDAGLLMDAEDDAKLAEYLTDLFTQPQQQARLRQLSLTRAPQFTWHNAASQTLDVYESVYAQVGKL